MLKHLSNTSSDAEALELRNWLKADERHPQELDKITRIWEASGSIPSQRVKVDAQWELFKNKHFTTSTSTVTLPRIEEAKPKQHWWRYAAAIVLFIGLGSAALWFSSNKQYQTQQGERMRITLADGSSVTLVNNTTLSVPRTFNWFNRTLSLEGEALFQVAKNPDKAFLIESPLTNTQVLGTAFRLKASNTQNAIEVSEGKVAYWRPLSGDSLILVKGESAALTQGKLHMQTLTKSNADAWISGKFSFKNTPLPQVLAILQDYYAFSIDFTNQPNTQTCGFTGNFDQQSRESVLQELALAMDINYRWEHNTLVLTEINCAP
jgi:ferric-dicitrate binding protein FerR (iron transport regulator)